MSESRVVITADAGRAVQEFQRFRTSAVNALDHVSQAGGVIGKVLGAAGASLSIAAFTGWIKGAIDATDAASDLSQKTGIAIEDLAGMELAFEKGGMEAGALESTMAKLSKQIVDGNEAFERLGVGTKDSTGQLKTNKDMLYELADRFAEMEDGVQKTALAQEIFGKSGAAMIPMLNEGSKGLREMDEMARKLGLSLSEEAVENAGNFNDTLDLLAKGGQGVARGIAAELLPTLSNLTGQFLTTMTSGDKLKNTAAFLAAGLKILYTAGMGIVEVFSIVGKTVGAAGAQLVAILQGNFKQAAEIGRMWQQDVGNSWAATIKSIEAAWDDSSNAAVDSMVSFTRHATVVGKSAAEVAEESKKAAKAHQEEAKALAEVAGLTGDFAGEWDKLSSLYAKGKISLEQLTKAQADLLAKQPAIKAAAEEEEKQRKVLTESAEQYAKAYDLAADAKAKALAGLQAQRDENEAIGLGALELAELNAQRVESRAQRAEENAEIAEGLDLTGEMAQKYRDEAAALRELAGEMRQGARKTIAVDEAKSAEEAWKKGSENIEKSLTDALLRGFESGKSIGKNLLDTLKNMFNTLVLRPVISAIVNPVAGALTGALGLSSPASAATGGAGSAMGSLLSSGLGIGGTLGTIGAGALQTAGAVLTGQIGLGTTLSAGLSAIGTGTASGIMAGLSSVVGALGPIALGIGAAVAIWKKLDTSGTYHTGGASSASAAGGVNTIRAESLNFERTRTNTEVEKLTAQLASGVVGILDSTAQAFGKTAGYTAATAFADDTSKDGAWGALRIMLGDSKVLDWQDTRTSRWAPKEFANGEAGRTQYLAEISKSVRSALDGIGLPGWAREMLDKLGADAGLDEMAKVVESINQTQFALKAMGEQLVGFSSLSDGAVSALIKASGGIQGLVASASAYYDNFYSQSEKESAVRKEMAVALQAVGLAVPETRAAFRALVEQTMALGEAGAPALGVLLQNAQAFAQLHPVVEQLTPALEQVTPALEQVAPITEMAAKAEVDLAAARDLVNKQRSMEAQIMRLQGDEAGALAVERALELEGMNAVLRPLQERIYALEDEAAATAKAAQGAAEAKRIDDQRRALEIEIMRLTGDAAGALAAERALELDGMEAVLRPLKERIYALQDEASAAAAAKEAADQRAAAEAQWLAGVVEMNRSAGEARAKAEADRIAAQEKAAAEALALDEQRAGMELRLYNLTHTAAEQLARARELELAALPPTLRALQEQIHVAEDKAKAEQAAQGIANERAALERELMQLQGNTAGLRELELAALDPANRAIKQHIWALQDQAEAAKSAAQAVAATGNIDQMFLQAQADIITNAQKAWRSIGDSLMDEVNRIRGVMRASSVVDLADAQAQFAVASAQARAGDITAAKLLPELSRALLEMAERQASSTFELRQIQAATAASLESTASVATKVNFRSVQEAMAWTRVAAPASASSGGDSSLAAQMQAMRTELVTEVQLLREANTAENIAIAKGAQGAADHLEAAVIGETPLATKAVTA